MNQLDKKLYNDLSCKTEIPSELDTVIKKGLCKKKSNVLNFKRIASFLIIIFATSGIVFAGSAMYDKNIWKEPERVVVESAKNSNNENEIKQNTMSEDDARKKANEILEKFGYKTDKIKTIKLENHIDDYGSNWNITTEQNIIISIDGNKEDGFSIRNDNILNKDITNYRTTKEEAKNTAKKIAEKYGYDTKEYSYIKVESNLDSDKDSYIYNVTFYKEYNGIKNPYESIDISYIPQINEIYGFTFYNKKFENNPVEITKEKAEKIVLNEEQKLSEKYEMYDIKKIETELKIVSMNGYANFRANEYEQLHEQTSENYPYEKWVFYRTESRIRMAWQVKVIYNINKLDEGYNINDEQFCYYIDATTGEVIGGRIFS